MIVKKSSTQSFPLILLTVCFSIFFPLLFSSTRSAPVEIAELVNEKPFDTERTVLLSNTEFES